MLDYSKDFQLYMVFANFSFISTFLSRLSFHYPHQHLLWLEQISLEYLTYLTNAYIEFTIYHCEAEHGSDVSFNYLKSL